MQHKRARSLFRVQNCPEHLASERREACSEHQSERIVPWLDDRGAEVEHVGFMGLQVENAFIVRQGTLMQRDTFSREHALLHCALPPDQHHVSHHSTFHAQIHQIPRHHVYCRHPLPLPVSSHSRVPLADVLLLNFPVISHQQDVAQEGE